MAFKMSRGIFGCLLGYYLLLPLVKINLLFPIPVSTLAQNCLQNEGHAEMPDFLSSVNVVFSHACATKNRSSKCYSTFSSVGRLIADGRDGRFSQLFQ